MVLCGVFVYQFLIKSNSTGYWYQVRFQFFSANFCMYFCCFKMFRIINLELLLDSEDRQFSASSRFRNSSGNFFKDIFARFHYLKVKLMSNL